MSALLSIFFALSARAANLMEVYQQALFSDQQYQQAVAQRLSNKQGVPISLSQLLPALSGVLNPSITKTNVSGISTNIAGSNDVRGYTLDLTLTQTVFNYAQFANLCQNYSLSKQADATLNAALQSLMVRVAAAYFAILQDEDNIRYLEATKEAYAKQLDQITQQYNVGLKTITDVYTARSSYDSSVAALIAARNTLADDRENLRVITGVYYPYLSKLSEKFPLISPKPADVEQWVAVAERQNWAVKAAQYNTDAARMNIKQQFAGHLPNLQLQGIYDVTYNRTITDQPPFAGFSVDGASHSTAYGAGLVLNIPIVQGGFVVANTRKAQYDYQVAYSQLEQQLRNTINNTRQSYLGVLSGISQIQADLEAIKSSESSLEGMQAGYEVGTQTLYDVLNQQKQLFQVQQAYAKDRYAYVNAFLTLKQAAGTLSYLDLEAINCWLTGEDETDYTSPDYKTTSIIHYHRTNKPAKHGGQCLSHAYLYGTAKPCHKKPCQCKRTWVTSQAKKSHAPTLVKKQLAKNHPKTKAPSQVKFYPDTV